MNFINPNIMRSKIIDNLKGPNAMKFKGIKCIKIATHKNSNIKNDQDYYLKQRRAVHLDNNFSF